jgi:hypothetical protein
MHMSLTRRTQILLDQERYAQLERRATDSGCSVAAVIREAIDEKLASDPDATRRREAGRRLLASPAPDREREPDWDVVKREMRDGRGATRT